MSKSERKLKTNPEDILLVGEKWWRSRYDVLQKHGYRLRTRYQPDWQPSWLNSGRNRFRCEDSYPNTHDKTIDALQLSSGKTVFLKAVQKSTAETRIASYLYSEALRSDPRNHCVPILDSFEDEMESDTEFIVMPMLRKFDSPPFDTVLEAFDFVRQAIEAVVFLHEKNVAHRDFCRLNIMYNAEKLYPKGYHPAVEILTTDAQKISPHISRTAAGGVKYYVTDFGISTQFEEGEEHLVVGAYCQDVTVPELSKYVPYDPFPVDLYTLGNVFKRDLVDTYKNINCLKPLIEAMTREDPKSRPTAVEALQQFEGIAKRQPIHVVLWKLRSVESNLIIHAYQNVISFGTVGAAYARRLMGFFVKSR